MSDNWSKYDIVDRLKDIRCTHGDASEAAEVICDLRARLEEPSQDCITAWEDLKEHRQIMTEMDNLISGLMAYVKHFDNCPMISMGCTCVHCMSQSNYKCTCGLAKLVEVRNVYRPK